MSSRLNMANVIVRSILRLTRSVVGRVVLCCAMIFSSASAIEVAATIELVVVPVGVYQARELKITLSPSGLQGNPPLWAPWGTFIQVPPDMYGNASVEPE